MNARAYVARFNFHRGRPGKEMRGALQVVKETGCTLPLPLKEEANVLLLDETHERHRCQYPPCP